MDFIKGMSFPAELNGKEWQGTIDIHEQTESYLRATVKARDSQFTVCLMKYFEGYGMKEYCACVPDWNFGCKLSTVDNAWNEEQFAPYIKNTTDKRSLSAAIWQLLSII